MTQKKISLILRFIAGVSLGLFAGVAILLMLKYSGVISTALESSVIVGLPTMVGILATLAVL
ncbi:MAG: hypothetical protein ABIH69_07295 [bacterium]